ncbi:hypothetical protein GGI35DRAFT_440172 [Trichoderma velutinum]
MIVDPDDWRGVTDPTERKKRQNRLRQRLLREKKRTAAYAKLTSTSSIDSSWNGFGILMSGASHKPMLRSEGLCNSNYVRRDSFNINLPESFELQTEIWNIQTNMVIPPLMLYTTAATFGQATPPLIFPLSPDHCLLTMVQYNVQRASLFNMAVLSLLKHLPLECGGTINLPSLAIDPPSCIPPELLPTTLQKSTPHPYWMDIFPCHIMRDNLIRFYGQYDAHDLHRDLAKSLYEGFVDGEQRGCMVWGEPWTVKGWEASEGFVRKWGFLLKGSSGLLASTNRWRESRGEDALTIKIEKW